MIAEYQSPAIVPDIRRWYEELYRTSDDGTRPFFRMSGVDVTSFETTVEDDPTVADLRRLTTIDSTSRYRGDFSRDGRARSTFSTRNEDDVVLLNAHASHDGWQLRMRLPNRETPIEYREAYTPHDCSFFLLSPSRETESREREATALTSRSTDRTESGLNLPVTESIIELIFRTNTNVV